MTDPHAHLRAIIFDRHITAAVERWLEAGFRRWWEDGSDPARLAAYLGFQSGTHAACAERNRWLRQAAAELPTQRRAARMKHQVDQFMRQQWHAWQGLKQPPVDAALIDGHLFYAASAGASMALSRRQFVNILNGK